MSKSVLQMLMRYFIILLFCFLAVMTGCKTATESVSPPLTPYQRAVGSYPDFFAGRDSLMYACLSLTSAFDDRSPDSTNWLASAAFNNGDYTSEIGLVSMGGQALPWHSANDNYKLPAPKFDSLVWSVLDYTSMNFSEKVAMPLPMKATNHAAWDTVSKSSGFTIKYSGSAGSTLTVSGIFVHSTAPFKDSAGVIEYTAHPDNGSVEISPELLKDIPVGSQFDIELSHDLFYSKVITQNTVSHRVGFYTQMPSDFFFVLGK